MVTDVDPNGQAAEHGLQPGDVILSVGDDDGRRRPADVEKMVADAKDGGMKAVLLRIKSGDQTRFVALSFARGLTRNRERKRLDRRPETFRFRGRQAGPPACRSLFRQCDLAMLPRSEIRGTPDMRILLIEDDRETAAYLGKALREAGHVTDHAADGETGAAMAGRRRLRRADRRPHAAEARRPVDRSRSCASAATTRRC